MLTGVPLLPITTTTDGIERGNIVCFGADDKAAPVFLVEAHHGGLRAASAHAELVAWLRTLDGLAFVDVPADHVAAPLLAASGLVRLWSPAVLVQELAAAFERGFASLEHGSTADGMAFWRWQPEGGEIPYLAITT